MDNSNNDNDESRAQESGAADDDTEPEVSLAELAAEASSSGPSRSASRMTLGSQARSTATRTLQTILRVLAGRHMEVESDDEGVSGSRTHSFSSSEDDGEELLFWRRALHAPSRKAKAPSPPSKEQLEALEKSDFYQDTKRVLGEDLGQCVRFNKQKRANLQAILRAREVSNTIECENLECFDDHSIVLQVGDIEGCKNGLSLGVGAQVMDNFLPRESTIMDQYDQKVFCGTYSSEGDLYMSACQGKMLDIKCPIRFPSLSSFGCRPKDPIVRHRRQQIQSEEGDPRKKRRLERTRHSLVSRQLPSDLQLVV